MTATSMLFVAEFFKPPRRLTYYNAVLGPEYTPRCLKDVSQLLRDFAAKWGAETVALTNLQDLPADWHGDPDDGYIYAACYWASNDAGGWCKNLAQLIMDDAITTQEHLDAAEDQLLELVTPRGFDFVTITSLRPLNFRS